MITITNVLYNIYPNLLQQYIRLKLRLYKKQNQTEVLPNFRDAKD